MKQYEKPELQIDLFAEEGVFCAFDDSEGNDGVDIDWYRPENDDE